MKIEIKHYSLSESHNSPVSATVGCPYKSLSIQKLNFEGELAEAIELFDRLGITSRNKRSQPNEDRQ
jgi:hypothetical protein